MSLWLVVVLTAVLILPVVAVKTPGMNDYPNHLARMYLLAERGTADQNPYYFVSFRLTPNLAMDIVVVALSRFIDAAAATKAFLILSQILVVSGAAALEIAVKGRHQFAGFAASAMLYCLPFAWGFMNFEFGVGLALWGLSAWIALEAKPYPTRLASHAIFSIGLFVSHLVAFGLYGATLGCYELWRAFQSKFDLGRTALTFAILVGPAIVILGFALSFGGPVLGAQSKWLAVAKLVSVLTAFNGNNPFISFYIAFSLAGLVAILIVKKDLVVTPPGKCIAAGFALLIVALPFQLLGGDLPEVRTTIGAVLILPAFLNLASSAPPAARFALPVALTLIALVNAGQTATMWFALEPELAAVQASFAQIPRGAFVLVGHSQVGVKAKAGLPEMPLVTVTALAAHYAGAFLPTLFTIPGQQPLQVCPRLQRFALNHTIDYQPVPFAILAAVANGTAPADAPTHVRNWTGDYDYLYLIGSQTTNPMPDRLETVAGGERFMLYRIIKPQEAGRTPAASMHAPQLVRDCQSL